MQLYPEQRRVTNSHCTIGIVTFFISFAGGTIGFKLGEQFRSHSTRAGGLVLCLIGLKVLLEHTGYLYHTAYASSMTASPARAE